MTKSQIQKLTHAERETLWANAARVGGERGRAVQVLIREVNAEELALDRAALHDCASVLAALLPPGKLQRRAQAIANANA